MSLLIRARWIAALLIAVVVLLAVPLYSAMEHSLATQRTSAYLSTIWSEVSQMRTASYDFALAGGERPRDQAQAKFNRLRELVNDAWLGEAQANEDADAHQLRQDLRNALHAAEVDFHLLPLQKLDSTMSARDQRTYYLFNQDCQDVTALVGNLQHLASVKSEKANQLLKRIFIALLILLPIVVVSYSAWLQRSILEPLHQMRRVAFAVSAGHPEAAKTLSLERQDELGDLSRALALAIANLADANKDLENFSYSVSHDLRAPLRAIDGFVAILLEDYAPQLDAEGQRKFGIVAQNARKMGELIDDILAFSRAGRLELAPQSVDMESLVREVWASLTELPDGRKLDFELKPLPSMHCDPRAIRQVWQNLLSNALKFTGHCETAVISVTAIDEGPFIRFAVADNGIGFNQEYASKLFVLFQRLHGMDEFEGTGVGLAIVKRFVLKHGGDVDAQGQLNQGATFSFTLPKDGKTTPLSRS